MFLLRKRGGGSGGRERKKERGAEVASERAIEGEKEREREREMKVIAGRRERREREKNGEKAWNGEPSVSESKEARRDQVGSRASTPTA